MRYLKKIFTSLLLLIISRPVLAQQVDPLQSLRDVGVQVYGTEQPQDIKITIARLVQIVLGFVGILFIILIILGGFQWMTSGGNEQKIDEAKKRIANATIGLTVILLAYAIAFWITNSLVQASQDCAVPGGVGPPRPGC